MSQMVVVRMASSDFYLVVVFARFSLFVVAFVFLALGVMSLIAPMILTPLVEIALPTPIAQMEVRGVYGGLFLGIGMFFVLSARRNDWLRPGLVAQASVFGGFVVGRTVGIAVGGAPNGVIALLLAGEVIGLVVALALLAQAEPRRTRLRAAWKSR